MLTCWRRCGQRVKHPTTPPLLRCLPFLHLYSEHPSAKRHMISDAFYSGLSTCRRETWNLFEAAVGSSWEGSLEHLIKLKLVRKELATLRHERKTKSQIAARRIAVVFRYCTCIDFCILQANGTRLWHDPCDLRILQFLEICSLWVLTLEVKGGRCFFLNCGLERVLFPECRPRQSSRSM